MRTSWWYESAVFDLENVVALARLTVRDDGSAEILTDAEAVPFASSEDAEIWLTGEEYARLETLHEIFAEQGRPIDARLRLTSDDRAADMVIRLAPPTKGGTPLTAGRFDAILDPAAMTKPG